MKTIIIDDEYRSIEMLEYFLNEFFPEFDVVGKYTNVSDGLIGILQHNPQILFLDINMPEQSGINLFEKIGTKDRITIFVTAHKEYAIDAIQLGAFDYLLKPVSQEELQRLYERIKLKLSNEEWDLSPKVKIKISNRNYLFENDEIVNVCSKGNYSTIHFVDHKPIMITKNLKKVQTEYFSDSPFFRVHQSNLVNLNHIVEYSMNELVLTNEMIVPISSNKYKLLENQLSSKKHSPNKK